jgi:hypothetical protein
VNLGRPEDARKEIAKVLAVQPWYTAARWRDLTSEIDPVVIDARLRLPSGF